MEGDEKGRVKWNSLKEELEALRQNPVAQSLLRDLNEMEQERGDQLLTTLSEIADAEEGAGYGNR